VCAACALGRSSAASRLFSGGSAAFCPGLRANELPADHPWRRFIERKSRDQSRNAAGSKGFVGVSSVRNGNGHYPCHPDSVRWGIRGPQARL
jgi:hypothetical protein